MIVLAVCAPLSLQALDHLPGDTITNNKGHNLQHDVVNIIVGSEVKLAPSCKRPAIVQTMILGQPRVLGRMMQWSERWTVDRCGVRAFYVIHFDFRGSVGNFKVEGPVDAH